MKELSIEEKAKHYDEALKRAKNEYQIHKSFNGFCEMLVHIFPELKEDNNEIMRKNIKIALMSMEDNLSDFYSTHHTSQKELLAWLEKQCEKKHVVEFNAKDWYVSKVDGKIYNAKFMEKTPINQTRKLEIEKAAMSATGIIEQEEWFIKGAEWSDKNPSYINSEKQKEYMNDLSPEQEAYLMSERFKQTEKEKDDFTTRQFLQCLTSFDKFKKGEHYWLEYIGGDMYVGRSDNVLGEKFHITPCQLYTIFKEQESINNQFTPEQADVLDKHIDKILEQKPVVKVELKFHEGEWLCENEPNNYARFIQILKTSNAQGKEIYRISRDIHNDEDTVEFDFLEKYYHKFNIKDAKDGDVLCYKDEISLYKHDIKNCTQQEPTFGGFVYHCCDDGKRFIMDSFYSLTEQDKIDIHPATKEQRDLLFAKMKEAGYEWDSEKKEVKKIEQAAAGWSEEDKKELKVIIDELKKYVMFKQYGTPLSVNDISWLEELPSRFITQQQLEWSEEDKYLLDETIQHLESLIRVDKVKHCACDVQYYQRDIDWLKSLRPQPHWEPAKWSEEDNVMLKNTLALIETVEDINKAKDGFLDVKMWLKSLKDKYTWKPSDEQMETLRYACGGNYVNLGILESLYKELKQLKKL